MVSILHSARKFIAPHNNLEQFIVPSPETLYRKLNSFIHAGISNLQIISDFDYTFTRSRVGSFAGKTSVTIAQNTHSCRQRQKLIQDLIDYYSPLEASTTLDHSIKSDYMKEWWAKSCKILVDDGHDQATLERIVSESNVFLRHGADHLFRFCKTRNVPIVVVSAGYGNVIDIILRAVDSAPTIEIHANFLDPDEYGKLTRRRDPVIVSMDKEQVLKGKRIKSHLILMGDMTSVRFI